MRQVVLAALVLAAVTGCADADAADWKADAGFSFGASEDDRNQGGGITLGPWGTLGFGDVLLEAQALASSYRYLNIGDGPGYQGKQPYYDETFYDFNMGLAYAPTFRLGRHLALSPQLGGGFTAVDYKTRLYAGAPSYQYMGDSKDRSTGHYVQVAVSLLILDKIRVGLQDEFIRGTHIQLFGQPSTANHDQATLFVGYHWK